METNQEFFRRVSGASEEEAPMGELCAMDLPRPIFQAFLEAFRRKSIAALEEIPETRPQLQEKLESLIPPTFDDFNHKLQNSKNEIPLKYAKGRFEDYQAWLMAAEDSAFSGQGFFLKRFAYYLPLADRLRHTYIVGESGSGKSELLKTLCIRNKEDRAFPKWLNAEQQGVRFIRHPKACDTAKAGRALVLIDPHGNLADEVAQQDFFHGGFSEGRKQEARTDKRLEEDDSAAASLALMVRKLAKTAVSGPPADPTGLIYINPLLDRERFPTINPFDLSRRRYRSEQVESYALHLSRVFTAMLSGGNQTLSLQMETLLVPCINVLLNRPGSTLFDLQRFMDDASNGDLVTLGRQSENPGQATFFRSLFSEISYKSTKVSIATKCQSLLNNRTFARIVASPRSTVDLEQAINEGKSIVVNCAKGALGAPVAEAFGRFLVAMVMGIALNRTKEDPRNVPIDLVIDECHTFIGDDIETILAEARGYGLHLTLSQQVVGQGMSPDLTRMVLGNTNVKIVGKSGRHNRTVMSKEMGLEEAELEPLTVGRFVVKSGSKPAVKLQMTDEFLGRNTCMSRAQWEEIKASMLDTYYRKQEAPAMPAPAPYEDLKEEIAQHKPFSRPPKAPKPQTQNANAAPKQAPKYEIEANPFSDLDL